MTSSKLIELTYYDPAHDVRLTAYADTIILDTDGKDKIISAVRFGGSPEMVRAMSDAIYGGAAIEAVQGETTLSLKSRPKGYQRQLFHDGIHSADEQEDSEDSEDPGASAKAAEKLDAQKQPRKCYIFCPAGDWDRLFEELDRKTAAPLIPAFRDYVLDALIDRGSLRPLEVYSIKERLDAWVLDLLPEDKNVVEVLERGLADGSIAIPGVGTSVGGGAGRQRLHPVEGRVFPLRRPAGCGGGRQAPAGPQGCRAHYRRMRKWENEDRLHRPGGVVRSLGLPAPEGRGKDLQRGHGSLARHSEVGPGGWRNPAGHLRHGGAERHGPEPAVRHVRGRG